MIVDFYVFTGLGFGLEHVSKETADFFYEGAKWAINLDFFCFRVLFVKLVTL